MLRLGWCWLKILKADLCINASVVGWDYSFRPGRLCTSFCHSPLRSWPNPRIVLRWLEVSVGVTSLPESNPEVLAGLKSALLVISTPTDFGKAKSSSFSLLPLCCHDAGATLFHSSQRSAFLLPHGFCRIFFSSPITPVTLLEHSLSPTSPG